MARIRTIKPEFGQHDRLSALPAETHLIAALLLPYADDYGYFNAHPKLVQAGTCPLRTLSRDIPEHLQSLQEVGYIELCTGKDGRIYGRVCNFNTHQVVSHKAKSKIAHLWNSPEDLQRTPESLRPEGEGEMEVELEVEEIPEQQPPLNCARRLMEVLNLTQTLGFLRTIEASIVAEAGYLNVTPAEAAQQIATHAMDHRRKGHPLDKWYFEETKWRNGNGAAKQTHPAAERVAANREVLADIAREVVAERTGPHSDKREDSARAPDRKRISASAG